MSTSSNPAKESLKQERKAQRDAAKTKGDDAALNDALKDTFPASDPVAAQSPIKTGEKTRASR